MSKRLRWVARILVAVSLLGAVSDAGAVDPEDRCQSGRYQALARFSACALKATAKFPAAGLGDSGVFFTYQTRLASCGRKYAASWAKLQAAASGTGATCDAARFQDDGATVTDKLTGLQWEKKTDDASVHDKDNAYVWTAGAGMTAADGSVFTSFLDGLNGACFAGQCDWRLPTITELQTILLAPYPCTTNPCLDPVFGPTQSTFYWSATTVDYDARLAWSLEFVNGISSFPSKNMGGVYARAVRGGL